MRNAQRSILSLLLKNSTSGNPPSKTRLVKIAFLVSRQISEKERGPFYEFLPYKYGPFSFVLYRDLSALARDGWLNGDENLQILENRKSDALNEARKMPGSLKEGLARIWDQYGGLSNQELIQVVYSDYPDFTHLSELVEPPPTPPRAPIAIYTIGYEGVSIDGFLNACIQNGIGRLLDVRHNPCSRKWGFSKKRLADLCLKMHMEYLHLPELGIPPGSRKNLVSRESYDKLLDHYEKDILPPKKEEKDLALEYIGKKATALVCMEADVTLCHRGRLAKELARTSGLSVKHLKTK